MTKRDLRDRRRMRKALKREFPDARISIRADGRDLYRVRVVSASFSGMRVVPRISRLCALLTPLVDRCLIVTPITPSETEIA